MRVSHLMCIIGMFVVAVAVHVPHSILLPAPRAHAEEPESLNLAAAVNGGRIAYASNEHGRYPAANLIDGYKLDFGEWWSLEEWEFPLTIVFKLAGREAHVIDHVVLNPWTSEWRRGWIKDFDLYASERSPRLDKMQCLGSFHLEHLGVDQTFTFEPVSARYVGLLIHSHYGSEEGVTLNEFEVYAAPAGTEPVERRAAPDNLVAAANGGSILDCSSEDSSGEWPVEKLIDGRKDTPEGWSSASMEQPQYIVFGLRQRQLTVVDRVALNPYSDGYKEDWVKEFELRGSKSETDINEMTSLGKFSLEQKGQDQTFTFEPIRLRYIALIPLSNFGGKYFGLNEFEVYAAPKEAAEIAGAPAATPAEIEDTSQGVVSHTGAPGIMPPTQEPTAEPQASATQMPEPAETAVALSAGEIRIDQIEVGQVELSAIVPSIYHLYGPYFEDLAVIPLTNRNLAPVQVRVETVVPNYTDAAVKTIILDPGETFTLRQSPALMPGAFDLLGDRRDATLHLTVECIQQGDKKLVYEDTSPIWVYPRNDFPWNIPGFHNGTLFLATMVTPNHPKITELLRTAADHISDGTITSGYGDNDENDSSHRVWNRMKAIYDAVSENYDVTYVAAGVDFVPTEEEDHGFTMQRLKLPNEVLETRSGMCVEVSTLFASAFEAIDLRPILITVPGHAYVAVPVSQDSHVYYFLEGTLVGQATFEEAIEVGHQEYMDEAKEQIEKDRLDDYFWLDVSEAREEGIIPIAFQ